MEQGNLSNSKMVGKGVWEYRIDFGPGYRIYYGHDGPLVIVLLCGGTKKRQRFRVSCGWPRYLVGRRHA
ncbi:MAG: type II toxin-antitoxin system RelE/ParE family toxin, partial [Nitrospirota bacterium]